MVWRLDVPWDRVIIGLILVVIWMACYGLTFIVMLFVRGVSWLITSIAG